MPDDQDFLRAAADMGAERIADYRLYQEYYDGEHKTQLTDRQREYLESAGIKFAENFCETIVDVATERMNVVGFGAGDNEPLAEHLSTTWQRNRMDSKQTTIFNQSAVKGDAFVIVDLDPQLRARYTWNRSENVKVIYSDDSDEKEYAVKRWNTSATSFLNPSGDAITRMNLYYPDRIERYYTNSDSEQGSATWQRWTEIDRITGLPQSWPLPWIDSAGEPLGVPVIHFTNKAQDRRYGRSELRGVIPQQEALNKNLLDLWSVLDLIGDGAWWATGVDDGNLTRATGELVWTANELAKFGQFDAADPKGMLDSIAALLHRMASRSRTPLHLLMMGEGQLPSGESLKTAEAPLVKKVEDRNVESGNSIEDMSIMGVKLEMAFGNPEATYDPDSDIIETQWDDPQSRNETAFLGDLETKLRIGVAKDTVLREAGYDPDEEREKRQVDEDEAIEREEQAINRMAAGLDSSSKEAYNG